MTKKEIKKIAMLLSVDRKLVKHVERTNKAGLLFYISVWLGRVVDKYIFDMGQRLKISHYETIEILNKIIDEKRK